MKNEKIKKALVQCFENKLVATDMVAINNLAGIAEMFLTDEFPEDWERDLVEAENTVLDMAHNSQEYEKLVKVIDEFH